MFFVLSIFSAVYFYIYIHTNTKNHSCFRLLSLSSLSHTYTHTHTHTIITLIVYNTKHQFNIYTHKNQTFLLTLPIFIWTLSFVTFFSFHILFHSFPMSETLLLYLYHCYYHYFVFILVPILIKLHTCNSRWGFARIANMTFQNVNER